MGLAGYYFRKHNPAISFTDISGSAGAMRRDYLPVEFQPIRREFRVDRAQHVQRHAQRPDGDGRRVPEGLRPLITNSPAFADSLLVITWDEGSSSIGGGGQVATLVISPLLASSGMQSSVAHNHYSLLRTIEPGLGLPCLNNSCQANDLSEFFG